MAWKQVMGERSGRGASGEREQELEGQAPEVGERDKKQRFTFLITAMEGINLRQHLMVGFNA